MNENRPVLFTKSVAISTVDNYLQKSAENNDECPGQWGDRQNHRRMIKQKTPNKKQETMMLITITQRYL